MVPDGCVLVGRVLRHHGLDGSLRIQPHSDNPARFQAGGVLIVAGRPETIVSYRELKGGHALLFLDNVKDFHSARQLAGEWLFAAIDDEPDLPPGEYYHYQLVGLNVVSDEGEELGSIQEVLVTGSNDVYVVAGESGAEILLPAIQQVVREIDLPSGRMVVHLIDGLR